MQASGLQSVGDCASSHARGIELLAMNVPVLETGETSDFAVAASFNLQKLTNSSGQTQIARERAIFVRFRAICRPR